MHTESTGIHACATWQRERLVKHLSSGNKLERWKMAGTRNYSHKQQKSDRLDLIAKRPTTKREKLLIASNGELLDLITIMACHENRKSSVSEEQRSGRFSRITSHSYESSPTQCVTFCYLLHVFSSVGHIHVHVLCYFCYVVVYCGKHRHAETNCSLSCVCANLTCMHFHNSTETF